MLQIAMDSKTFRVVYGIVFPICILLLLLGIASFTSRPLLFGAIGYDLTLRILISVWFCGIYIQISRVSSFSYYPNLKWTKTDIGPLERYYIWIKIIIFCIAFGVITWWVIHWFFAIPPYLAYLLSVVHSLIIFLPSISNYWVFKQ